ncbi:MAG TPA: amidase [Pseudonocardiaceae bacterium]|jgi:amidase|nr:amidase [Pseudonocardiaceae bacterium]
MASARPASEIGPLLDSGAGRLVELLAEGAVTSVGLTTEVLRRIEASQPTLNAFRRVRAEAALAEAAEADRALAAGSRAPLLGLPLAIKDDVDLAGEPTAFGCAGDFPPAAADCELVRLLKAAGAVIVGKTNTPELGQWPFTEGEAFGVTRNPWQPEYTPGGSSGGSAAAVAAGAVPVAVGSDGAGSIRIPAAWTNLVGIKPQRDRISPLPARELFYGITTPGPLARTVADAALLLGVLAARPDAPYTAAAQQHPGRLRIALALRPPFTGYRIALHPEVRAAVERLAGVLANLGYEVHSASPRYGLVGFDFLPRSTAGLHEWSARIPDPALLDPRTRANIRTGRIFGRRLLGFSRASNGFFQRRVGRIFDTVDVVLTPSTATPPPLVGAMAKLDANGLSKAMVQACPYAWPWNTLGWPAINVPAGRTSEGLPLGAQLLGPAHSERRLISLAAQLESRERWSDLRPPIQP